MGHGVRIGASLIAAMDWRSVPAGLGRLVPTPGRLRVEELTGITPKDWEQLETAFPDLPRDAGRTAARSRRRLRRLCARALRSGQWDARVDGAPPSPEPAVYVTAHVGGLQALRYVLRARGVAAATVVGPHNLIRPEADRQDRIFDARHPNGFPHVLPARRAQRLRLALRVGSLIAAADLPAGTRTERPFLGGSVALDSRPMRLARATRVPCRPAFLTLPEEGWTLTLGSPLPSDEEAALASFAELLGRVAARAPWDLDGVVYRALVRERR